MATCLKLLQKKKERKEYLQMKILPLALLKRYVAICSICIKTGNFISATFLESSTVKKGNYNRRPAFFKRDHVEIISNSSTDEPNGRITASNLLHSSTSCFYQCTNTSLGQRITVRLLKSMHFTSAKLLKRNFIPDKVFQLLILRQTPCIDLWRKVQYRQGYLCISP